MSAVMMRCGHAANAQDPETKAPRCVICIGIRPGADEVNASPPDLTGRTARCPHCRRETPSRASLPFFEHHPGSTLGDSYYCGCRGWE